MKTGVEELRRIRVKPEMPELPDCFSSRLICYTFIKPSGGSVHGPKESLLLTTMWISLKLGGFDAFRTQSYQICGCRQQWFGQGLEKAENENPDLIVLDVMMREWDGYEGPRCGSAQPADGPITPILKCSLPRHSYGCTKWPVSMAGACTIT